MVTENLHLDEDTLFKVRDGVKSTGLCECKANEIINALLNKGILFRERQKDG